MRLSQIPRRLRRPDPGGHVVKALRGPLTEALALPDASSREAVQALTEGRGVRPASGTGMSSLILLLPPP